MVTAYNKAKPSLESAGYSAAARAKGRGGFSNSNNQAHADRHAQNAPRFGFIFA